MCDVRMCAHTHTEISQGGVVIVVIGRQVTVITSFLVVTNVVIGC